MAHELSYNDAAGQHEFVKAGSPPWHNLGKLVSGKMTSEEALEAALLTWEVAKVPLYYKSPSNDGEFLESKDFYATIRTDTNYHLGCVMKKYNLLQNKDTFKIIDDIVGSKEAVFESAGALNHGRTVFLTAKLPEYFTVEEECIDQYLVISNSHTGAFGLRIMFTPICVVCNNTLQMAIQKSKKFIVIRHTEKMQTILADISKAMNIINQLQSDLNSVLDRFVEAPMNAEERDSYFKELITRSPDVSTERTNVLLELHKQYAEGLGARIKARQDTVWGGYQAVTNYYTNIKKYRGDESRMKSILDGTAYKIMKTAKDLAYEYA